MRRANPSGSWISSPFRPESAITQGQKMSHTNEDVDHKRARAMVISTRIDGVWTAVAFDSRLGAEPVVLPR